VPSAAFGFEHTPVVGSQVPATWQGSLAAQTTGWVPVQTPDSHRSACVQALPSSHDVPSAALGFEHAPAAGSHVAPPWHGSLATQVTGLPPVHTPTWQLSGCVQALASSQEVPSGALGFVQMPVPGSHTPASWH